MARAASRKRSTSLSEAPSAASRRIGAANVRAAPGIALLEPAADLRSVQREDVDGPPTDQRLGTRLGSMRVKTVERLGLDRHQERQPGLGLGQPGQARRGRGDPGRRVLRRSGLDQEQPGGASLGDEREERAHDALAGGIAVAGGERRAEPGTQPRRSGLFGRLPQQPPAGGRDVSLFRQGHSEERVALEGRLAAERGAKLTGGPVEPPGRASRGHPGTGRVGRPLRQPRHRRSPRAWNHPPRRRPRPGPFARPTAGRVARSARRPRSGPRSSAARPHAAPGGDRATPPAPVQSPNAAHADHPSGTTRVAGAYPFNS